MSEKTESQTAENAALCDWCGIPLGSANLVRESVCVRCYKILIGANLSDAEIFVEKKNDDKVVSPSRTDREENR